MHHMYMTRAEHTLLHVPQETSQAPDASEDITGIETRVLEEPFHMLSLLTCPQAGKHHGTKRARVPNPENCVDACHKLQQTTLSQM